MAAAGNICNPPDWTVTLKNPGAGDQTLIHRAHRMDREALAEIHDQFYPVIYRYVRFRLSDDQVCEDITSEVFLRLIDALDRKLGPKESLRGWLIGTASNLVNDHLRKRYHRPTDNLDDQAEWSLQDEGLHPEEAFSRADRQRSVQTALRELTWEQQHVLALRFTEERSLKETAQLLGKSVTAVKALQFRAIASLRRFLEEGHQNG